MGIGGRPWASTAGTVRAATRIERVNCFIVKRSDVKNKEEVKIVLRID
jgi:hypothetical protein